MEKILSRICLNGDIGVSGNMFGGAMLSLMDEAAAIYAQQVTHEERIVTRCFSGVSFDSPVHRGEILEFYTENPKKGTTSFSFDIVVLVEGERRFGASCVFVALDRDGNKKAIDWSKTALADL